MRGYWLQEFIRDYLTKEIDSTVIETKIETTRNYQKRSENSRIRIPKNFIRTHPFS